MEFLNKNLYEAKLVYYTPTFDDKVRTFCTNPSGEVATEYYENGLAVVNGHAYKSQEYKTNNTNFAILVSKNFTKPFKTPIEYGKQIAQLSNMLCDGKILVQTFGDFQRGRRTTEERLCRGKASGNRGGCPVLQVHGYLLQSILLPAGGGFQEIYT